LVMNSIDQEFEPFNQLSLRALKFTTKICRLQLSVEQIDKVNEGKLNLDPFPDSKKGFGRIKGESRSCYCYYFEQW
jgi:hypothetical protein